MLSVLTRIPHPAIRNAAWMIAEKVVAFFGLIIVTAYVASYIGPALFGRLTLAAAIFQIVQTASQLGSDSVIFKRVARNRRSGATLIRASTRIRALIYFCIATPILIIFTVGDDWITLAFFGAAFVASFLSSIDVYSIYNNAILQSKFNAIANTGGLLVGLSTRYLIAWLELPAGLLAVPIIATVAVPLFFRFHHFRKTAPMDRARGSRKRHVRYLINAGAAVALSSISIALYTRINQFAVSAIDGEVQMGIYAAALSTSIPWSFIAISLITSFYPKIYAERNEAIAVKHASRLLQMSAVFGAFLTLAYWLLGDLAIRTLYGIHFAGAYWPGVLLCVSVLISCLGTVSYRFIVRHSGYSYLSKKMLLTLIIAPCVAIPMTMKWGILGASLSVVLIEFLSCTILNYGFKNGLIFRLHLAALGIGSRA